MPLSEADVRQQVRRLLAVFATSKPEDEIVRGWMWVLCEDVTPRELARAVADYAKSGERYFPVAGKIRQAALEQRGAGDVTPGPVGWDQLQEGPCPVCGAVLQLAPDPVAQKAVWAYERDPKTTRWTGKLRSRTKDDPPPVLRYTVIHDATKHQRAGVPIVGRASYHEGHEGTKAA